MRNINKIFYVCLLIISSQCVVFAEPILNKNVTTTINTYALSGVWEIKDSQSNLYLMNATSDGEYVMSASNALGDSHGVYKAEGQNKFKMEDWSFVYNNEGQAESIQTVNAAVTLYDNGTKLEGVVKVSIKNIKTGEISKFESKCSGVRLSKYT